MLMFTEHKPSSVTSRAYYIHSLYFVLYCIVLYCMFIGILVVLPVIVSWNLNLPSETM
jgi:hypothetical protein